MQKLCIKLAISLLQLLPFISLVLSDPPNVYNMLGNAYLCITSNFVNTYSAITRDIECASMCNANQLCRAFTINDGPCQLFVFDKCSKSVRDCSCSRKGQVFVKQQPGLEAGALCPSGYEDDLCGVKYKRLSGTALWWPSRAKCESESGLVIMADVMDATEMSHVDMLYTKHSLGTSVWLGGHQKNGSAEPTGGWYWVGCNITVDGTLWNSVEPDNRHNKENVIGRYTNYNKLVDFWEDDGLFHVLCECVSPFG